MQRSDATTKTWVLVLASIASFMVALDSLVITTALTTIRADLDASLPALEWTVNAYILSFAVLVITASELGDRLGRRRVFVTGIALFTAASAGCALAPTIGWLIAARVAQGVGEAMVLPLALSLLSAAFPASERARALGVFSGVTGLAVLSGPVVGGLITEGLDWRWVFWLNVPLGVALIPMVRRYMSESVGPERRLDARGLALIAGASFAIMWGLVRGNDAGWTDPGIVVALVAGAALAVTFVVWERRAPEPMLPTRLFRSRTFSFGSVSNFFLFASLFGTLFFLAQFFQSAQGTGPLGAGLRLLPWTATLFVTAPIAGALVNRIGERPLITVGLLLQGIGMAWIALIVSPDISYARLVPPLILAGIGVSMAMPATQSAVLAAVDPEHIGKASGVFNMLRQFGAVFGIAILVAAFSWAGGYSSARSFGDGFAAAIGVSAILSLLGLVAGLALPGRSIAPAPVPAPA